MIEIEEKKETVILVAVDSGTPESDVESSLDELAELVKTAGASVSGRLVQKLDGFNPGTYIGKGKIEELRAMVFATGATGIVTDDELTPVQMHNLSTELDIKVMDRTMVILDIFALHASTAEGKLQVELAQLNYRLSRLTGKGASMSRLGGGIGTRGPGEKKLEVDRRAIRSRVAQLRSEIREMTEHRKLTRAGREGSMLPVFAIVGYTNAGKSTLLNTLTGAEILAEDMLFATLDTTTRVYEYARATGKQRVLLTDTVGFIRKLPHNLIDAFRSTLEEAGYADYIIHVVDASSADMKVNMKTVYATLDKLGITERKIITVFNKIDKLSGDDLSGLFDNRATKSVRLSAREAIGIDELSNAIDELLREDRCYVDTVLSYSDMNLLAKIKKTGEIEYEEYVPEGVHIKAFVPGELYGVIEQ
ncbi:MAG: GTPase HflX [Lachnospiraceae bacterium]|nr:GTPase HflX [Lachnospiraceae bacterium]